LVYLDEKGRKAVGRVRGLYIREGGDGVWGVVNGDVVNWCLAPIGKVEEVTQASSE
jgi:hypothetical protein